MKTNVKFLGEVLFKGNSKYNNLLKRTFEFVSFGSLNFEL